jgi:protein-disulfide isomerase
MRTQLLAWAKLSALRIGVISNRSRRTGPRCGVGAAASTRGPCNGLHDDRPRRNGVGNQHARGATETGPRPGEDYWHESVRASGAVDIRHATTRGQLGRLLLSVLMLTLLTDIANAQSTRRVPPATMQAILAGHLPTPGVGAAQGEVTVVEYFDYDCPVCRHLEPELRKLLANDPKVRVVRKDWPVFGEASDYAAYCSLAAAREGRHQAAHDALIASHIDLDSKENVQTALQAAGFDVRKLNADIQSHAKEYSDVLARNRRETAALGLQGTPGLIVGSQLVLWGIDYRGLERLVAQARTSR